MNTNLATAAMRRAATCAAVLALGALMACQPKHGAAADLGAISAPGAAALDASRNVQNPLAHDPASIAQGHRLFISMNCAGCHGYGGGGAMGPDLTDPLWRYGGTATGIYKSIFEGRPQGMPSWGRTLPAQEIWQLTAYVQSLGGALEAADYHAGLQGDHDLTLIAPEARNLDAAAATGAPGN